MLLHLLFSDINHFITTSFIGFRNSSGAKINPSGPGQDLVKLNYPNGDMVGHTGVYEAVVCSMEAMDLQLGRLRHAIEKCGGVMVITADHGNADDMYEHAKDGSVKMKANGEPKTKTSHSLNPVPCIIFDPEYNGEYPKELNTGLGISSIAATLMNFLGFDAPDDYDKSIINLNK